jgi:hypothetical protein
MSDRIRTVTATVPASVCPDPARLDPQEPGWGVLGNVSSLEHYNSAYNMRG